jgi:type II secretion system protein J
VKKRTSDKIDLGRRGFTIAEVLVAILITSILAGVIYGSYMGGLKIIYASQKDMERTHMANIVLNRIASDLACAFLRADKEYLVFVGQGGGDGEYSSDGLTFISSNHERSSKDARESTLSEVSYFLDPEGGDELYILRREDPSLDEDPFSGGETRIIGEGVAELKFEYNGEGGWTSSWDSRENSSLPIAVRVSLVFRTEEAGGGEEGEEAVRYTTFTTETAVPAGGDWEEKEEEEEEEEK